MQDFNVLKMTTIQNQQSENIDDLVSISQHLNNESQLSEANLENTTLPNSEPNSVANSVMNSVMNSVEIQTDPSTITETESDTPLKKKKKNKKVKFDEIQKIVEDEENKPTMMELIETHLNARIEIKYQQRNKKKGWTTIYGLDTIGVTDESIIKNIQKKLNDKLCCGSSIQFTTENKKTLQFQGDHRQFIKAFLIAEKITDVTKIRLTGA
jgi:translation initiation factor 1 (eIF-1/SUI1)